MVRRADVDGERPLGVVPRPADMGGAGAVIHHARPHPRDRRAYRRLVEQVDGLPGRAADRAWVRLGSRAIPRHDARRVGLEQIEQMAAGEPRGAGDKRGGRHAVVGRQRGTPLIAPLNGEKLPRPASVNDRKKRWSAARPMPL